ncbi:NAD(P)/FAD-dependent oxidoreductase [Streptomyces tricolor]|nr:NAD(P)/FAD-dependent oxidoreductase [Streptomyces tricolor]
MLIVGTGLAGLGMAVKLAEAGHRDFVILEKAGEVGGTWRENTYPGCACDVASVMYSYSFAPNRNWSRMYAEQPEILDYIKHVVKERDLEPHIRFHTEVTSYEFDEAADRWHVRTRSGQEYRPRIVVLAHGALHQPNVPDLPGMDRFKGELFHSAQWDHSVDLRGKRVAVIGTGSSAVQFIPRIAGVAAHVDVFQRNAHWVLPKADRPLKHLERRLFASLPFRPAPVPAGRVLDPRAPGARLPQPEVSRRPRTGGEAHAGEAGARPRAAGQAHPHLPHRLQTHPAHERLLPGPATPGRLPDHLGDRGVHGVRDQDEGRRAARGGRGDPGHRLLHRQPVRERTHRRPRRTDHPGGLARRHDGPPGHHRRGVPEPLHADGTELRRRRPVDPVRHRGAGALHRRVPGS